MPDFDFGDFDFDDDDYDDEDGDLFGDELTEDMTEENANLNLMHALQSIVVDGLEHVKKYKRLRKIHGEVMQSMVDYWENDKFELEFVVDVPVFEQKKSETMSNQREASPGASMISDMEKCELLNASFNLSTDIGYVTNMEINVYKFFPNAECLTEVYIRKKRFRKPEKVEMLHAILNSRRSLFQVTGVEPMEARVFLTDVFTGEEYTIVDIGMSLNKQIKGYYYRRLITVGDICFGDGPAFPFGEDDEFIQGFIKKHKANYHPEGEFARLIETYNRYKSDKNRIKMVTKKIR
ncbi:MAG: hypothetical protein FWF77_04470 [Defluviitaleaceae bacterium]|nr:hypothetical protein [Defluviitaleaceae bacterium]